MVSKRIMFVGVGLALVAGCAIGLAIGGYQGFRIGTSFILNEALFKDAREVETRIAILKHVRAGEQDQATKKLETGLADILIGFDPAEPYAGLDGRTVAALRKAIGEAKLYWSANPRQQKDFRDKMVDSLFARELYK